MKKKTTEEQATLDYLFSPHLTGGQFAPHQLLWPNNQNNNKHLLTWFWEISQPDQFFFFLNKRHFMQLLVNNRHRLEGKSQKLSQQFFFLYLLLPFSCFCLTAIRSFSSLQQLHGSSTPKSQCRIRQLKAMPELHRADETSCKLFLQHWVASKN